MIKSSVSAVTTATSATATTSTKTTRKKPWVIVGILAVIVLFWAWPKSESRPATNPNFHSGRMCLDDTGLRKELHYENVVGTQFKSAPAKGCWIEVNMPPHADRWRSQQVGNDRDWQVYYMMPGGKIYGPFGWASDNVVVTFPQKFWMQGTKDGEEITFSTTDH